MNWKNQTIDLSDEVGYAGYNRGQPMDQWAETYIKSAANNIINYNSGITIDKAIYNEETYAALKDDPDAFGIANTNGGYLDYGYSRYNHDSAVNTINSLPITNGGNTIKFRGAAGAKTDGGAINTLTEAEIAVATAKG